MDECVLAEGPGRVALTGGGQIAALSITDEATVCFVFETAALAGVLDDVPLQLSRDGSHCRIEAIDAGVRLEFALAGVGRGACIVRAPSFAEAVEWVRTQGDEADHERT